MQSRLEQLRVMRDDIYQIARTHKIGKVYVFGSCARQEETPESDIDLIVEFDEDATLFDHGGMLEDMKELLQCKVDVVSSRGIHPYIAKQIWAEAILL